MIKNKKKREADKLNQSFRFNGPDCAASQTAAELKALEEEQKQKKKEADQINQGIDAEFCEEMNTKKDAEDDVIDEDQDADSKATEHERLALELIELKASRNHTEEEAAEDTPSSNNLNDIQARKQAELDALKQRQPSNTENDDEETLSPDAKNLLEIQSRKKAELELLEKDAVKTRLQLSKDKPDVNSSLEEIHNRTALELEAMKEARKTEVNMDESGKTRTLDEIKSRTSEELAMLQTQASKSKISSDVFTKGSSKNLDDVKSRTAAELTALKDSKSATLQEAAQAFDCNDDSEERTGGLETPRRSSLAEIKSKTTAELKSLQSSNESMKKAAEAFDRGITSNSTEALRSRTEAELASLGRSSFMKQDIFSPESSVQSSESIRSPAASDLEALKANNGSMRKLAEEFSRGLKGSGVADIKSRTAAELNELKGAIGGLKSTMAQFSNSAQHVSQDSFQSRTEAELAAFKGQGEGGLKNVMEQFSKSSRRGSQDSFQSRTEDELAALKGKGDGVKRFAQEFGSGIKSNKQESFKSRTDAELKALQQQDMSKSMKEVTQSFNRGIESTVKCERTAEELKALADQRVQQRENEAMMEGEDDSALVSSSPALSEAELKAIGEEREALAKELESQQWNHRTSAQKLKEQRSRAAAELEALRNSKKKGSASETEA
mmetsp:Transcript_18491/g.27932  ORF Transcript_18491/g.27932 Transcript_18491/m.27932 type:complete len:670 (-) Transcript_18491:269-2278(-)